MKTPVQLTFGNYGHTLHHCQVISPDNHWLVYDTRNSDTEIGITTRIERVNVETFEVEVLYEVKNANSYGPGVGAATYSPIEDRIIFIHGISNSTADKPYGMSRRTGVSININNPNVPIYMDARNIYPPFTVGALRGGTHSHCWNSTGDLISFTYNDFVLEENNIPDERVVGVMFPKKVKVPLDDLAENISGEMFSVIVTDIVNIAKNGSDEIEKAFDECWLGNKRTIAFQGWVRDENGNRKTEIFKVDLPNDLTFPRENYPLEGTDYARPSTPKGINCKRVTNTLKGVSSFRHWLRTSPDGDRIYFLKEDDNLNTNLFVVYLNNGQIKQLTYHEYSIDSPFNISPNGLDFVYFSNFSLYVFSIKDHSLKLLVEKDKELYGTPNFDKTGNIIFYNKYVYANKTSKFLQILKIER